MSNDLVLVTGGSGFVAAHCIVQLLHSGYRVRTTLRSPAREADVRAMVWQGGISAEDNLNFATADLTSDTGWEEATRGARFVLHVASPNPLHQPKSEEEIISTAREGTLRVLRAARSAAVERVVITSSISAVKYIHPPQSKPRDEGSWTDVNAPGVTPYAKSKTLAEQAAWQFVAQEDGALELAVINPGAVYGPVLGPDLANSVILIEQFVTGKIPACPRVFFYAVDARDLADLHLRAMTNPAARGERFLAINDQITTPLEIAKDIQQSFPEISRRMPKRELPDWLVRLIALVSPAMRPILPELGGPTYATNRKAKEVLGWTPRGNRETIAATVESLMRMGLVKP